MKIIGIVGSLRDISYTRFSLKIILEKAKELGAEVELIDLRDYNLPFCEQIKNEEDFPEDYFKFKEKVDSSDAMIWGTPEYHGMYKFNNKQIIEHYE